MGKLKAKYRANPNLKTQDSDPTPIYSAQVQGSDGGVVQLDCSEKDTYGKMLKKIYACGDAQEIKAICAANQDQGNYPQCNKQFVEGGSGNRDEGREYDEGSVKLTQCSPYDNSTFVACASNAVKMECLPPVPAVNDAVLGGTLGGVAALLIGAWAASKLWKKCQSKKPEQIPLLSPPAPVLLASINVNGPKPA